MSKSMRVTTASKRARGLCLGNTKTGYTTEVRDDGLTYIVPDERELAKVAQVRLWRVQGLTYKEIIQRCLEEGITSRQGSTPVHSTVRNWIESN